MLKKNAWIAALFAATAMLFMGCPEEGGGGGDETLDRGTVNPIVDGASYLRLSGRTENWFTVDIKAGKADAASAGGFSLSDLYTASKKHTITVYGSTVVGTNTIRFANTDGPYGTFGTATDWATAAAPYGDFTLEYEFTYDDISAAGQNIRIQLPANVPWFNIYEIVITDEDGLNKYKLSTDTDIQDADNGEDPIVNDTVGSTYLLKGGNVVIQVIIPGEEVADVTVGIAAIPGVTPPASGATPVATIDATIEYTGTVAWADDDDNPVGATFADDTVYTATITLTVKDGYTFDGVPANFFTVFGATPSNAAGTSDPTIVVTATFPATQAPASAVTVTVDGTEIQTISLTAPSGEVTILNDGSGYTYEYGAAGYRNGYAVFKIDLGGNLSDFASVDFTYNSLGGDGNYKPVYVYASTTTLSGDLENNSVDLVGSVTSGNPVGNGNNNPVSIPITAAGALTGELYFVIAVPCAASNSSGTTVYTISNIKFILADDDDDGEGGEG